MTTRPRETKITSTDEIAERAYELYEMRGREPGHELDDWLEAERDVRRRSPSAPSDDRQQSRDRKEG